MSEVNIFDVEAVTTTESIPGGGWYTQTITGEAPPSRVDFCVVVVSAPDNSSFNIYMYGGKHRLLTPMLPIERRTKTRHIVQVY